MWHTMQLGEVVLKLKSDLNTGLNTNQVEKAREVYGKNNLAEGKKENIFIKFLKQFNDFMIIVLIIASIISALMEFIERTNNYLDSIIIIVIVILNAIMGVLQEAKAEKSLEALKKLSSPTAKVKRNGQVIVIPSEELVPGDYILLETGSYVPADARLIKSTNLKIEESAISRRDCSSIKG